MILPAKLVNERLMFVIDYGDKLPWGSVITLAKITVDVSSGTDPNPQRVFSQTWDIDGTKVTYQVQQGLPGVIYNLNTAVHVAGEWLSVTMKLAVMPDQGSVGALYPLTRVFTSHPYPQIFYDNSIETVEFLGGLLKEQAAGYLEDDALTEFLELMGGALVEVLPPEIIDNATEVLTLEGGSLVVPPIGNIVDKETEIITLEGGLLKVVPTGEILDNSTETLSLQGGSLEVA